MSAHKEPWWQKFSLFIFRLIKWEVVADTPPHPKYVLIGAPHTTNWDWVFALLLMSALGLKPRWVGKQSLFRGIAGPIMRGLGGIPVVRGGRRNFVGQIVDIYNASEELVIVLAPEGTRKYVDHWKSGFYYIALGAQVPVGLGFVNYEKKKCGIGGYFVPSGNLENDVTMIRDFYAANAKGKYPEGQALIRFKSRKEKTDSE